jgi:hypothetical protein
MTVAQRLCAMRLTEIIVTYLAAAAPFGVAHFYRLGATGAREAKWRNVLRAALAALLWPAGLIASLLGRRLSRRRVAARGGAGVREEARVERQKRALVASLMRFEEMCEAALGATSERARQDLFAARAAVERHAGLSLAADEAEEDEREGGERRPSARETELCRLAGRSGDDLLVAGLCLHRRNLTRLVLHRERAREEVLHALASARELPDLLPRATREDGRALRSVSESLITVYAQSVELFSVLDDRAAVLGAARLLDAECARLRRLETLLLEDARPAEEGAPEGEPCTTRAELTAYATDALLTGSTPTRA